MMSEVELIKKFYIAKDTIKNKNRKENKDEKIM